LLRVADMRDRLPSRVKTDGNGVSLNVGNGAGAVSA